MKKYIIILVVFIFSLEIYPKEFLSDLNVIDFSWEENDKMLSISFTLNTSSLNIKQNQALVILPYIIHNEAFSLFKPIRIYSKSKYIETLREDKEFFLLEEEGLIYKKGSLPLLIKYEDKIPYEDWMLSSLVNIKLSLMGCCEDELSSQIKQIAEISIPELIFLEPEREVKTREYNSSAFIDFRVNSSVIDSSFNNNKEELKRVSQSLEKIKKDPDIEVKDIHLKGWASPEGNYKNNLSLAIKRAKALKEYLRSFNVIDSCIIETDYEAEDWQGLKDYIIREDFSCKEQILNLISLDITQDEKKEKFKNLYPNEWNYLLKNCFSDLRRTDFKVQYEVKEYNDINDIKYLLKTNPKKLSSYEIYQLALEEEPLQDEFKNLILLSLSLYPDEEVVNLNAANVAILDKDFLKASSLLLKAGQTKEAYYTKGVLAYLQKDFSLAKKHLLTSLEMGELRAEKLLKKIKEYQ